MVSKDQMLDYARLEGLTCPDALLPHEVAQLCKPFAINQNALDYDPVPGLDQPAARLIIGEKLALNSRDVTFLTSILHDTALDSGFWDSLDGRRRRRLKLDNIILQSDPQYDLAEFKKALCRDSPQIVPPKLKIAVGSACEDVEDGQSCDEAARQQLASEKLTLDKPSLLLLQEALTAPSPAAQLDRILKETLPRTKTISILTPPLLPAENFPSPAEPSSPVFLALPSPILPSSPIKGGVRAIEREIFEEDGFSSFDTAFLDDCNDAYNPDTQKDPAPGSSVLHVSQTRAKAEELYVETPLTPPERPIDAIRSSPALNHIPDKLKTWPEARDALDSDEEYNHFFDEVIDPAAFAVRKMIEQEKPTIPESSYKVKVPRIEPYIPHIPWALNAKGKSAVDDISDLLLPIAKLGLHHWSKPANINRELAWVPIWSDLARKAVLESLEPADVMTFLDGQAGIQATQISDLTWKPDGLRVLDPSDDDDEEIPLAQRGSDIGSLARKRKIEYESPPKNSLNSRSNPPEEVRDLSLDAKSVVKCDAINANRPFSSFFSTTNSLERFLSLKGQARKKLRLESTSKSTSSHLLPSAAPQTAVKISTSTSIQNFDTPGIFTIPTPPPSSHPIIVDSNVILQTPFMHALTDADPNIHIVERQYRSDETQPDAILAPSTGVLLTTLQRVKQKSLPGQSGPPSLHARIQSCVRKYERLVVLVNIGTLAVALDPRDCDAILDLQVFAATLAAGVEICTVSGDEKQNVAWILSLLNSLPELADGFHLLPEETLWELFLRKTGLNPYAAQVILSALKRPAPNPPHATTEHLQMPFLANQPHVTPLLGDPPPEPRPGGNPNGMPKGDLDFGLAAFIRMTPAQRRAKFARELCGVRVLDEGGQSLDVSWRRVMDDALTDGVV